MDEKTSVGVQIEEEEEEVSPPDVARSSSLLEATLAAAFITRLLLHSRQHGAEKSPTSYEQKRSLKVDSPTS